MYILCCRVTLCKMINEHLYALAQKFPQTKFIKSVSSVCIPNYPDKNLPTIFVYCEGDMKKQYIGAAEFGTSSITLPGTINVAQVISSRGTYRAKTDVQSRDIVCVNLCNECCCWLLQSSSGSCHSQGRSRRAWMKRHDQLSVTSWNRRFVVVARVMTTTGSYS